MEILKKPYKKSPKARKYAGAKWPHERASIAIKQALEKDKKFKKRDYNKERAAKMREWTEWF